MENTYLMIGIGALIVIIVVAIVSKTFKAKLSKDGLDINASKQSDKDNVDVTKVKKSDVDLTTKKDQNIKLDDIDDSNIKIK